jgi:hypothetical protein
LTTEEEDEEGRLGRLMQCDFVPEEEEQEEEVEEEVALLG